MGKRIRFYLDWKRIRIKRWLEKEYFGEDYPINGYEILLLIGICLCLAALVIGKHLN